MKDKLLVFIVGVAVGLMIGVGFFIFKLDGYFSELSFYKHLSIYQGSHLLPNLSSKEQGTPAVVTKNNTTSSKQNSIPKKYEAKDTIKTSTDAISEQPDTIFEIKKDQLIATKQIELGTIAAGAIPGKDSLNSNTQLVIVELWRSPINYKGYKMTKGKLILFGINEMEDLKLWKQSESTFLKLPTGTYKLENTDEFKSFEKLNENNLLQVPGNRK